MALLDRVFARRAAAPAAGASAASAKARPRRELWKKIALGVGVFFVVLILFGFFAAPPIIKSILVNKVSEQLGRQVSVGAIHVNPFLLTVEIEAFLIKEKGSSERFVAFDKLRLDAQVESVYRRAPVLREIKLDNPYVHIVRIQGQRYNFSDLIDKFAASAARRKPGTKPEEPALFSLNNIQLTGGSVDFDDRPENTKHRVRELKLAIPFLSNLPYYEDIFVRPAFAAKVNGTPVALNARTKPFDASRETSVDLKLTDLNLPFYLEYVPFELHYKPLSALLDANLGLTFAQPVGRKPTLSVAGTVALRDLKIQELSGSPLVAFDRLDCAIERIDVFARKAAIRQIKLSGLDLTVHRAADGELNVMSLLAVSKGGEALTKVRDETKEGQVNDAAPPGQAAPPPSSAPPEISVAEILVPDARIAWVDDVPEASFRTTLAPLKATIRNFDTAPDALTEAELDATTDAGETIGAKLAYAFIARTTEGSVTLGNVPLKRYAPYYRDSILFDLEDGTLDATAKVAIAIDSDGVKVSASEIESQLKSLRLRKRGDAEAFLRMAQMQVHGGSLDLARHEVTLAEVTSRKASVAVTRAADGKINLADLTPPPKVGVAVVPPAPGSPGTEAGADTPWLVTLKRLTLDDYGVRFDDRLLAQAVVTVIDPIRLVVDDFQLGGKPHAAKVDLKLAINKGGELKAKGLVTPQPVEADMNVALNHLAIGPFQPYFADKVNITLASGEVAAVGTVRFSLPPRGKPLFEYDGTAAINRLATLDKQNAEDFLKWESLFFDGVRLKSEPLFIDVKKVALTDFYSRMVVNEDGSLNLQGIMANEPAAAVDAAEAASAESDKKPSSEPKRAGARKPTAKGAPAPSAGSNSATGADAVTKLVKIDQVTLQGGTINFSDRSIKPNVSATMTEVGGRVTGLMSDPTTRADVDLRGKLSNQAPLTITGKINPLAGDLFADIKVSFIDIELPPFTPYSGKYTGYTIEKGKLTLDLTYLIDKRKLKAENKIFIDQLTFGDKVESADATKLPVQLAIALLKDRDGRINLDVPIEGSLDDPKFRLGKVIWQVIVNLVTKAVTAPFALIGSLLGGGGGEQLSYVEFAPGTALLDAEGRKKLDQLVKALRDRPQLKLEVTGHVDVEKDREALRQGAFERKLKAQKWKDLAKTNQAPPSIDDVTVAPGAEYEKYLELAYRAEKFPKPRNFIGLLKDLPVPEMEKLMQTHIVATDDDLRNLAVQREQAVKDAFLKAGDIGADRVFLVEPRTLAPAAKEKLKASRVDFVLR